MSSVEVLDRSALEQRRQRVLSELSISEPELRRRVRQYQASADELAAVDQLDELDFLSGA